MLNKLSTEFTFDETFKCLIVKGIGVASLANVTELFEMVQLHLLIRPTRVVLYNLKEADLRQLSNDDILRFIEIKKKAQGMEQKTVIAIVVSSLLEFGRVRMYQERADLVHSGIHRVFMSDERAWEWIKSIEIGCILGNES